MKLVRLVYIVLLLTVAGLGCQPDETEVESIKIKPSRARGEAHGRTLLHQTLNGKITERLINEGADVNAKDNYSKTPMHSAAHSGNANLVELLIIHEEDVNTKDNEGRSLIDCAQDSGHTGIVELLHENGAKK